MRPELEALQAEIDAQVAWDRKHPEEARERRLELLLQSRQQVAELRAEALEAERGLPERRPELRVIQGGDDA